MSTLGVLGLASRIVDDLEILVCMCRVYWRASPRPSRRRVVRALVRTVEDAHWALRDFGSGLELRPRLRKSRRESAAEKTLEGQPSQGGPTNSEPRRRLAAELSRIFVLPPEPDMKATRTSGSSDDEALVFQQAGPDSDGSPPRVEEAVVVSERRRGWRVASRALDELAVFGAWRATALAVCGVDADGRSRSGLVLAWLGARFAALGLFDPPAPLPPAARFAFRRLLAHPLEALAVRCLVPASSMSSDPVAKFWAGWRGALVAGILDARLGLGAAARLKGLAGRDVALKDATAHLARAVRHLPAAIAAVLLARFAALLLFGGDRRRRRLERRLESYLDAGRSARKRGNHRRDSRDPSPETLQGGCNHGGGGGADNPRATSPVIGLRRQDRGCTHPPW